MNPETDYDICLMAEGTYPYVSGGVSSCIAQMVQNLPEYRFAIFYIGSSADLAETPKYKLPDNVVHLEKVFLFEGLSEAQKTRLHDKSPEREAFYAHLHQFLQTDSSADNDPHFTALIDQFFKAGDSVTFENFCHDPAAWDLVVEACRKHLPEVSFVDFFYTSRFISMPLWTLFDGLKRVPKAKVYHSLCTGYAGIAAVAAARRYGSRSIITEHGIYVKERIAEISLATWIHEATSAYVTVESDLGALKKLWIQKFRYLAEYCYRQCDGLTTLYHGNQKMQEEFGAPEGKTQIIPNGIDMQAFALAYEKRKGRLETDSPKVIGFVGRVVRIKDVKTLLRAMAQIHEQMPDAILKLFGPTDEEPEYFAECQNLTEQLQIEDVVEFAGKQNLREALADIDIMVLTSVSEGQPLVILEGYATGIPCVATDVGSCRALIFGDSAEDRKLGSAGYLTKVASPRQTASSLLKLLQSPETLKAAGETGRRRVEKYYQQDDIMQQYREVYQTYLYGPQIQKSGDSK